MLEQQQWLLYGTKGCHLCDNAENLLMQAQCVLPMTWQYIDIALDENLVTQYGSKIPVLVNLMGDVLYWPFSLLDIQTQHDLARSIK